MLTGFKCPLDGKNTAFRFCQYDCPSRCMELPILLSLMGSRDVVPGVYSVTEILKPPRIVNYNRQQAHYASPFDLMFMQFGTAFHEIVAGYQGQCPGHLFEHQLYFESKLDIGGREITLRGTPDQYDEKTGTLTDYKTAGYYSVKLLMEGKWTDSDYQRQVNIYRRFRFPDCEKMQLVMLIKDFNRKLKHDGVPPLVTIQVPKIDDAELDTDIKIRLFDILDGEKDWAKSRDCTDQERWKHWKTGEMIRCEDYCLVAPDCPQFNEEEKDGRRRTKSNGSVGKGRGEQRANHTGQDERGFKLPSLSTSPQGE